MSKSVSSSNLVNAVAVPQGASKVGRTISLLLCFSLAVPVTAQIAKRHQINLVNLAHPTLHCTMHCIALAPTQAVRKSYETISLSCPGLQSTWSLYHMLLPSHYICYLPIVVPSVEALASFSGQLKVQGVGSVGSVGSVQCASGGSVHCSAT